MPTFNNLEALSSVRAKINIAIAQTEQNTIDIAALASSPSGVSDGDKGDVVVSGGGTVWTLDPTAASLVDKQPLTTVLTNTTASYTIAEQAKLAAIAAGATVNSADAVLLDRANHTGVQSFTTVTGTKAQLDAAITDGNVMYVGDVPTAHTHLLSSITDVTMTVANLNTLDDGVDTTLHFHATDRARANHTGTQPVATITGLGTLATQSGTFSGSSSGTNTGDQTSIVGITGTKAQFNTAATDGDFLFVGDAPTAHTHLLTAVTDVTMTVANLNALDDGVNTALHFHDADRARANHTGTQLASTISDFSTAVAATASVTANTAKVTNATHTGDVTGATTLTIETGVVSNAKLATMPANTIKGNNTGAIAAPADLTVAQTKTLLAYTASDLSLAAIATSGSAADLTAGILPAARFDDTSHGARAGGTLHANVVAAGAAGFMTGADKTKLDGIEAGAEVNVGTNIVYNNSTRALTSSTGTDTILPLVTTAEAGLAPASGGGTTNFLRADGTWAAPAGGGGGGGATGGTATIDFGAAPGTNIATVVVTGQASIGAASRIKVWFQGGSTADFNEYEHLFILPGSVSLVAGTIVNGVGFTIYATTQLRIRGNVVCRWEWS